ncbi:MAG: hypothetical protein AVDCRST_MAG08-1894, partial [uncultured Acetobacteraceae bacterium]
GDDAQAGPQVRPRFGRDGRVAGPPHAGARAGPNQRPPHPALAGAGRHRVLLRRARDGRLRTARPPCGGQPRLRLGRRGAGGGAGAVRLRRRRRRAADPERGARPAPRGARHGQLRHDHGHRAPRRQPHPERARPRRQKDRRRPNLRRVPFLAGLRAPRRRGPIRLQHRADGQPRAGAVADRQAGGRHHRHRLLHHPGDAGAEGGAPLHPLRQRRPELLRQRGRHPRGNAPRQAAALRGGHGGAAGSRGAAIARARPRARHVREASARDRHHIRRARERAAVARLDAVDHAGAGSDRERPRLDGHGPLAGHDRPRDGVQRAAGRPTAGAGGPHQQPLRRPREALRHRMGSAARLPGAVRPDAGL